MAISREERTAVALEGSVGPLTLAAGARARVAGSTRPRRRMASTSVVAAGRNTPLNPRGQSETARRHWISLVEEARAAYEAGRVLASLERPEEASRTRDQRRPFVRHATNGVQPE